MQNANSKTVSHFKTVMIRGAMVFFPFAAIIYGFKLALSIADGWLGSMVATIWGALSPQTSTISHNPVFSLLLLVFLFYSLGAIVSWRIGNSLFRWLEQRILKIQGIGKVYGSLRKVMDMVGNADHANNFKRVVFVPFLPNGGRTIAFVTNEVIDSNTGAKNIFCFIPTPPNPISGLIVAFPENEVADSEMTVEEAIQFCVSLGMAAPDKVALTPAKKPH